MPHVDALFPGFTRFRHVMGCAELDAQVARLAPRAHAFGHSHVDADELIGGTRFVQRALGHSSDGRGEDVRACRPLLVWETRGDRAGAEPPRTPGHRRHAMDKAPLAQTPDSALLDRREPRSE